MANDELLPCPFCKDAMRRHPVSGIIRHLDMSDENDCLLAGFATPDLEAWNKRALPRDITARLAARTDGVVEALEHLPDRIKTLLAGEHSCRSIESETGVSKATVSRASRGKPLTAVDFAKLHDFAAAALQLSQRTDDALREALESALCAPDWAASLGHVHDAIARLGQGEATAQDGGEQ